MSKIKFTEHQKKYINKNAQKWVQMVFNDDMDQAAGRLQRGTGFCCLGVGALCYQMNTGENLPVNEDDWYVADVLNNEFSVVQDWLGLRNDSGDFGNNSLSRMNDTGKSFKEIGQFMLDNPEKIFYKVKS